MFTKSIRKNIGDREPIYLFYRKGASDHLVKNIGQGAPENIPPNQWGKRQHENEVTEREERKAQIVYQNPGYKRGRSDPAMSTPNAENKNRF